MYEFEVFGYQATLFVLNCVAIAILVVLCIQATSINDTFFITIFFSTVFIACDIVFRLFHFLVYLKDISQCNVDLHSVLMNTFGFQKVAMILIMVTVICFVISMVQVRTWPFVYIDGFSPLVCLPCIVLSFMLLRVTGCTESSLQKTPSISSMKGLDYGTGMAYSYYYGYLKIILPSTGTATKGLLEKIQNIEDAHNITLASQKLIILIPSSSYIPPDLKEASYQWMESAIELEQEERARAGVKRRSYRNNLYKIYPGGQKSGSTPKYVVAEGATPLLTFFEVQKHSHPESGIYKKYHKEVVEAFYKKLLELLNSDTECKDLCELIYYDDYNDNGIKVNIAKVILQRLSEIKNITVNADLN